MLLNIAQHRGVRNFLRHLTGLLFLEVLLDVEQRLQIPERIVDLLFRHLGTDACLAADNITVVSDQQLPGDVLANVVRALVVA